MAKSGHASLRRIVSKLLSQPAGLTGPQFAIEIAQFGIKVGPEEAARLHEHYCDSHGRVGFQQFAAAFLPKDWAAEQYAMAELEREEQEARAIFGDKMRQSMTAKGVTRGSTGIMSAGATRSRSRTAKGPGTATAATSNLKKYEADLRHKLYQKTSNIVKRSGLTDAYKVFVTGVDFPDVDRVNWEYGINSRLNLGWPPEVLEGMFQRYDKDRDGVISFEEFGAYVMPPDVSPDDMDGVNIKAENNTLLGFPAKRI